MLVWLIAIKIIYEGNDVSSSTTLYVTAEGHGHEKQVYAIPCSYSILSSSNTVGHVRDAGWNVPSDTKN